MSVIAYDRLKGAPVFYGGAFEFWRYKGQEAMLSGPYECIAGETRIYNPDDNSYRSIQWYHDNGIAPTVFTMSGKVKATIPFIKGFDALYRVTLSNGMSFVATKGHCVLTNFGWTPVSSLVCERLQICGASRLQSTLESGPQAFPQDVQHSSQTTQDSQSRYSACCHRYDARFQSAQDSGLNALPSQADVHEHSYCSCQMDAHESLSAHTHLYQSCAHLSNCGSSQGSEALCESVYVVSDVPADTLLHACDSHQPQPLSLLAYDLRITYESTDHDCAHKPFDGPFNTSLVSATLFNCTIKSVIFERYDLYYDLHVPGAEHYLAEGVFHHNSGKTLPALTKLHALLVKYPHSRAFITRQTYKSLLATALVTYENKVLPVHPDSHESAIVKYGKSRPEFYQYPNGSHLLIVGMDNPDKILSGEFDFGYVNQAEEIALDAWEKLVARCTGRAGNAPYTQVIGDCNPSHPQHWILHRAPLKLFEQLHRHNPSLFDQDTHEWTKQGTRTISILSSLTGIRKERGYLGKWVAAEGTVYEFSAIHRIARENVPEIRRWYLSIDFGYTNPFVCQLWGVDGDGRLYLWHEIYMTKRTVAAHVPAIKAMIGNRQIEAIVADHDAEDRATLREHGLATVAAKKDISLGIQVVQERLKVQDDGKPRLYVCEDACVEYDHELYREYPGDLHPCCTEHEFAVYAFPPQKSGKSDKEVPMDIYNHGADACRYVCMRLTRADESVSDMSWYGDWR